jgi:hypothetical protein
VYTGNRIVGSNPTPSAKTVFAIVRHRSEYLDFSDTSVHFPFARLRGRPL